MGNKSGGSRRKARDNAYVYSENRRDDYSTQKSGGSISRRPYQAATASFTQQQQQQQHSNGYGAHSISQPNLNSNKTTASKLIYIANYDFNGTSSTGELSFHKGDRLEILDRYS
jgi:hypothetical protein